MRKVGLTLGKYAPFHKGHEYVIQTMLAEMDEAVVVICDTPVTPIPLSVRAGWIRRLFPQVTVIEAWDGPDGYSSERSFEIIQERYFLNILNGRKIDAFYCSEFYGAHMAKALEAVDRRVDEARLAVPISGTAIRANPYQHRAFLSPLVYRDLIVKVVFLGAMSTGKSTLVAALAQRYGTSFATEYGRDYWTEHQVDRRIAFEAFDEIALGHIAREEEAFMAANQYCFVDTNAITTYMFALDYHGRAPEGLARLALENASRYDLFFLCEDDIPYDDTWDRSGDQKRHVFQKQIVADLRERRIPYIPLRGSLEARMAQVEDILSRFEPYGNFYGMLA